MKGHMQDGKFHPHIDYKKGVRKSRDQSTKIQGVKVERKARDNGDVDPKRYPDGDVDPIKDKVIREMEDSVHSARFADIEEENKYIDNEVERRKQKLVDEVTDLIKSDVAYGDVTPVEAFLLNMLDSNFVKNINENYNNLWGFIGDERQNKLNREDEFP